SQCFKQVTNYMLLQNCGYISSAPESQICRIFVPACLKTASLSPIPKSLTGQQGFFIIIPLIFLCQPFPHVKKL
ncbi:MAG: hypothetical protein LUE90_08560, partial [Clostridiales bacterium]|nr:hypothetical protein [Clostridiales bacterium]